MKNTSLAIGLILTNLSVGFMSTPSWAEDAYVIDMIYVQVRSGKGSQYRIIETGLPSGSKLNAIREEEDDNGGLWTLVETEKGNQGWIQSQYLQDQQIAKDKLAAAQRQLANLQQQQQSVSGKATDLETQNAELQSQLNAATIQASNLQQELDQIKTISAGALTLNENNQKLMEEREVLKTRIDVVEAENERLTDESNQTWFLYGAIAVGIGCLLTLIVQRVRVKRRHSEWA